MPCLRQTSPADIPAACSFSTLMICSSVNLLLRMSVSSEERTLPKIGGIYGEQVSDVGDVHRDRRRVERGARLEDLGLPTNLFRRREGFAHCGAKRSEHRQ